MKTTCCFLLLFLNAFYSCNAPAKVKPANKDSLGLQIKIYKNDTVKTTNIVSGFGYDITRDGAVYIHQPIIPAVQGQEGFSTGAKARKAAEYVLYKLEHNIIPPSVTYQELDSIDVLSQ